jgi:hypothetical protein
MAENKNEETKKEGKEIPLKWHIPDTIVTRYAGHIVVQIIENIFKLSFFEVKPEIRLGPNVPPLSELKEVKAECVASIIVTPDKFPQFIKVMQQQYDKYVAGKQSE